MGDARRHLWNVVVNGLLASVLVPPAWRTTLLRRAGVRAAGSARLRHHVDVWGPDLVLGDKVFVNIGAVLNNTARITLAEGVSIGPGVLITTTQHEVAATRRRAGRISFRPVTVGRGAWVGARAVVLPGVTIGDGCVVAAGAVVVHDCEPDGLYAGVPARRIRDLDPLG